MRPKGHIDRKKHEVDITERVLEGGVWAGPGHFDNAQVVVNLDVGTEKWPLGTVASTVRVQVGDDDDDVA
jgi:hypothetical protein